MATATASAPATATGTHPLSDAGQLVVLWDVSWATYEALLADHANRSVPHFTYDRGVLEIVSPTTRHEERKGALIAIVDIATEELNVANRTVGSMTYRRKRLRRGFEPDASYYIQSLPRIRGKVQIDGEADPPPDLVIEIDVTHSTLDKLALYARMGVPEVWRDEGDRVRVLVLRPGGAGYDEGDASRALPLLTGDRLTSLLDQREEMERPDWQRTVRAWVRAQGSSASS